jgi:glycosyltransferase involved in cell wall biosynthesis
MSEAKLMDMERAALREAKPTGIFSRSNFMRQEATSSASIKPELTVVVPIYNEEESIPLLLEVLVAELESLHVSYEIIAVNDGSCDASREMLAAAAARYPRLKVINFRRNAGQTAALMAGIDHAKGDVIVTIDADLQNDPRDIPLILAKLGEGYDVVSGWRHARQDAAIRRNLISRVANSVISRISGLRLHDYGCTLKAYRKEVLQGMRLYGEMHRFVPIYASWMGARVVEVPVHHYARRFGRSKYGLGRIIKVILDLIVVKFFSGYLSKPIYVFGGVATVFLATAGLAFIYMMYLKFFEGISMIQTPLPVLSAMLFVLAFVVLLMGMLAEILVRTYFESQGRLPYNIRDMINFDERA